MIQRYGPRRYIQVWFLTHHALLRRFLRITLVVAGVGYVCQLFYPAHHLLPFVRVADQRVGFRSVSAAAEQVNNEFKQRELHIATDDLVVARNLADLGGAPQTKIAAERAADYPFVMRLLPFSSLYVALTRNNPVTAQFNQAKLADFANQTEKDAHRPAVNAAIVIKGSKAVLVPSVPDKQYLAAQTEATIQHVAVAPGGTIHLQPQTTSATLTDAIVRSTLTTAQTVLAHPPKLRIESKTVQPKAAELAGWLSFPESNNKLTIELKATAVTAYLAKVQGDAYRAPGKTHVKQIDGREVSRQAGKQGHGVQTARAIEQITATVRSGKAQTLTLPVGPIDPELVYDNTKANADATLANLLADQARAKGGYGITMYQIDGKAAQANGDKQFIAASTYKLYAAYVWLKKVEVGADNWNETINGRNATQCFTDMIVVSDNACAQAFVAKVGGWSYVNQQMKSIGLTGTALAPGNLRTTANDLAYFLYRLENGTLVKGDDRTRLLDLMKRQVYRDGIPAGTGGAAVADKVGFVDGYLNDAGIVYAQKGTYVLVVMSFGSTWANIADVTQQINAYLTK